MATPISGYTTTPSSIVRFRSAYLLAIAKSWENVKFRDQLCSSENVLDLEEFREYLDNQKLPWSVHVKVRPNNSTVDNFDMSTHWLPGPTAGWFGMNDKFEIHLPPKPTNREDITMALATYNKMFPTLLGVNSSNRLENNEVASEDFVNFSCALLQAIALCWASTEELNYEKLLVEEGLEALTSFIGFNNPWNFNIKFISPDSESNPALWNDETKVWDNLFNKIILNYPNPPVNDNNEIQDDVRNIALASYNSGGAGYPFTCA